MRTMPKVRTLTIIGEAPNSQGVEKYDTQSGKRLLRLMGTQVPWHNIHGALPPRWSARVARARIRDWVAMHPKDSEPFLLLGRKVSAAFDIPKDALWLEWYATAAHRHPMIVFPHPSGQNRWWNIEANAQAAGELLQALASGLLPRLDYVKKDETT